ncbi:MAG: hypothetical protein ACOCQG_03225 [Candidatus Nanoarchaeia archaeon]
MNLPRDKFAVFGSGPLAMRSIRDVNDLDVIVKEDLWKELEKKYKKKKNNVLTSRSIEIARRWTSGFYEVDSLIDDADVFEGIKFVKLGYVIEWKKKKARKKDKEDIKLIEDYISKKNRQL